MNRTSSRHDFSGTNYRSCTLGWLAGIQQKRQANKKFFTKVCNEARELALNVVGRGKPQFDNCQGDSDCEIADRACIQSDESDEDADAESQDPGQQLDGLQGESESSQTPLVAESYQELEEDIDDTAAMSESSALSEIEESDSGGNHRVLRHEYW